MKKSAISRFLGATLALPALLTLAACGSDDAATQEAGGFAADRVENVAPPEGKLWSEVVARTEEGGYLMGNPDAPIKLIEWGALSCSHCAEFSETAYSSLVGDYVESGRVSYELRFYMLNGYDVPATMIATCSADEAVFPLAEQMWANQSSFYDNIRAAGDETIQQAATLPENQRYVRLAQIFGFVDFATARGISRDQAEVCLSQSEKAEQWAQMSAEQSQKYSITGTPTFQLNGTMIQAKPWEELEADLQAAGAR